jgi:hypothetical protein
MILNFWIGMTDWPDNNFYYGNRNNAFSETTSPAVYMAWDGEQSLDRSSHSRIRTTCRSPKATC